MHFLSLVLALSATATSVLAECWDGGQKGNKVFAYAAIDTVCNQFRGNFLARQSRTACSTETSSGSHWVFQVKRDTDSGGTLETKDCVEWLQTEAHCDYGGRIHHGGWFVKSDPNEGVCQDTKYINAHPSSKNRRSGSRLGLRDITIVYDEDTANRTDINLV